MGGVSVLAGKMAGRCLAGILRWLARRVLARLRRSVVGARMAAKRQASVSGKAARATAVTKLRRPRAGDRPLLGVIGGSGLYQIEGIVDVKEFVLETPFGKPSDAFITGKLDGTPVVFLPRHGRGHRISPTEINYQANIWGMKKLGVSAIVSPTTMRNFFSADPSALFAWKVTWYSPFAWIEPVRLPLCGSSTRLSGRPLAEKWMGRSPVAGM